MSRSASDVPSNHSTPTVDRRNLLQGVAKGEAQCHVAAPEKDPAYDLDDAVLANFMKVPRALTGMPLASLQGLRLGHEYLVQRDPSELRGAAQAAASPRRRCFILRCSGRAGSIFSQANVAYQAARPRDAQ